MLGAPSRQRASTLAPAHPRKAGTSSALATHPVSQGSSPRAYPDPMGQASTPEPAPPSNPTQGPQEQTLRQNSASSLVSRSRSAICDARLRATLLGLALRAVVPSSLGPEPPGRFAGGSPRDRGPLLGRHPRAPVRAALGVRAPSAWPESLHPDLQIMLPSSRSPDHALDFLTFFKVLPGKEEEKLQKRSE